MAIDAFSYVKGKKFMVELLWDNKEINDLLGFPGC